MGEYIRKLRKIHDLTQEELGQKLKPPVNRAAINKWESGQVENIKRSYIQQMSKLFDIGPCELMCFELDEQVHKSNIIIRYVRSGLGDDSARLLELFAKLNNIGKEKALNDLDDLTNLSKYTEKGEESSERTGT